jgi:hypothetical protein
MQFLLQISTVSFFAFWIFEKQKMKLLKVFYFLSLYWLGCQSESHLPFIFVHHNFADSIDCEICIVGRGIPTSVENPCLTISYGEQRKLPIQIPENDSLVIVSAKCVKQAENDIVYEYSGILEVFSQSTEKIFSLSDIITNQQILRAGNKEFDDIEIVNLVHRKK